MQTPQLYLVERCGDSEINLPMTIFNGLHSKATHSSCSIIQSYFTCCTYSYCRRDEDAEEEELFLPHTETCDNVRSQPQIINPVSIPELSVSCFKSYYQCAKSSKINVNITTEDDTYQSSIYSGLREAGVRHLLNHYQI